MSVVAADDIDEDDEADKQVDDAGGSIDIANRDSVLNARCLLNSLTSASTAK